MKIRLIGFVLVFAVLAVLYVVIEDNGAQTSSPAPAAASSSSDADFKSLKIQ